MNEADLWSCHPEGKDFNFTTLVFSVHKTAIACLSILEGGTLLFLRFERDFLYPNPILRMDGVVHTLDCKATGGIVVICNTGL